MRISDISGVIIAVIKYICCKNLTIAIQALQGLTVVAIAAVPAVITVRRMFRIAYMVIHFGI